MLLPWEINWGPRPPNRFLTARRTKCCRVLGNGQYLWLHRGGPLVLRHSPDREEGEGCSPTFHKNFVSARRCARSLFLSSPALEKVDIIPNYIDKGFQVGTTTKKTMQKSLAMWDILQFGEAEPLEVQRGTGKN